jgi:FkbM family methyltransferase
VARGGLTGRLKGALADAVRPLNRPRVYTARHGFGRGLKQIGGVSLVLPRFLRPPPEYPEFEGVEEAFLRGFDYRGKTIFDVGAFEGILTLFFAQQTGPEGRVVAFEPIPESYRRLSEHLELNGLADRVTIRNIAVGSAPGQLTLANPPARRAHATGDEGIQHRLADRGEHVRVITVPVNSLNNEIADVPLPDPDFVKIDVEGMELNVLEGLRATICRRKPKLYVEIHGTPLEAKRENAARVIRLLSSYGYSVHHVESNALVDVSTSERAIRGHLYCE